jgi:hypothetical protein
MLPGALPRSCPNSHRHQEHHSSQGGGDGRNAELCPCSGATQGVFIPGKVKRCEKGDIDDGGDGIDAMSD